MEQVELNINNKQKFLNKKQAEASYVYLLSKLDCSSKSITGVIKML